MFNTATLKSWKSTFRRGAMMDRPEFTKRLSKCSRESITIYLSMQFRNEHVLREIEAIEYDTKSKKLLKDMENLNKLSSQIEIKTIEDKIKWIEYHEKWRKAHKSLDKLNEWFDSRLKSEE